MRRARASAATRFDEKNGLLGRLPFAAIALLVAAPPVLAQDAAPTEPGESGFYLGADLGALHYSNACEATALSCDQTANAAGVFGGYRFGSRIGLELGYRDLGGASATYPRLTGTIETAGDVDGYELAVLIAFPLWPDAHAYLRGGAFSWRAHARTPEADVSETGWSAAGGGGAAWRFRPSWEGRMEYVYLDNIGGAKTGETDTQVISIGVRHFFGRR